MFLALVVRWLIHLAPLAAAAANCNTGVLINVPGFNQTVTKAVPGSANVRVSGWSFDAQYVEVTVYDAATGALIGTGGGAITDRYGDWSFVVSIAYPYQNTQALVVDATAWGPGGEGSAVQVQFFYQP